MRTKGAKDKNPRPKRTITENVELNARRIRFLSEITPDSPADRNDIPELYRRWNFYKEKCMEYGMYISNMNAYLAIGISSDTARNWLNQTANKDLHNFMFVVKQTCAATRENLMSNGEIFPATGIFWQKNYDNLRDQQEIMVTPNNPLGDKISEEELAKKYLENANIGELPLDEENHVVLEIPIEETQTT